MGIRRFPYASIVVFVIVLFLITGSEARTVNDDYCPGVCASGIEPDCNTLCIGYGYPSGYCKGLTCCCHPKFSKFSNIPLP
ncbi:hypothetical protein CARUB_v10025152mg [Capsella rubella]|uniref:Knottin scorpion toxin-like domain-containing protein n=1 Tax=Capsella rubella TaxID=81985 RepID=R0G121_9BRAS|nr:hypothetical protein CARUB_v10025152mg [Capsella rubella]